MRAGAFEEAGATHGRFDGALKYGLMQVMATALAREPIAVDASSGEDPLPRPLSAGVRVLPKQGGRQLHPARTHGENVSVLRSNGVEVSGQVDLDDSR